MSTRSQTSSTIVIEIDVKKEESSITVDEDSFLTLMKQMKFKECLIRLKTKNETKPK